MKRNFVPPLLIFLALPLLLTASPGRSDPLPIPAGADLLEKLGRGEPARVILFLALPDPPATDSPRRRREVADAQARVLAVLNADDFQVTWRYITVPALAGTLSPLGWQKLAAAPGILRADLDPPVQAHLAQSVPLIKGDQLHLAGYTGNGVTVAVLDTGVDTDHLDLADDLVAQECFCSSNCCPNGTGRQSGPGSAEDGNGHGTNVSAIITSGGVIGAKGVAPDASLVAIKVLANSGSGNTGDIVAALDWIRVNRPDVKVVNMSLGAGLFTGNCDNAAAFTMSLATSINNLRNQGTLCFASAGNDGSGSQMSAPACIANAISVGAVYDANIGGVSFGPPASCTDSSTFADKVTCFSNSNSTTDLFAPGGAITAAVNGGGLATYYGTSQASPHAAGCAADLWQAFPSLTPAEIEGALESNGVTIFNTKNSLSFPRVDCLEALESFGGCIDRDHDGYGQPGSAQCPNGAAADCNDLKAEVYPGAPQICDGINDNCSDPNWPTVPAAEVDGDNDTFPLCNDCNGNNSTVYPGAPQICDGINNNCSDPSWPAVPASELDGDGDGRPACNDCNNANAAIYPGAPQICDGLNNDCNHPSYPALTGTNEQDDDGDGLSECAGDCNDALAAVYPGAPQICDGFNNNCQAPGWPSISGTNETDDDGDSFTECQGDCNDANPAVRPGGPQVCDGVNNNCSAPGWPSLNGTNERDDDSDGLSECQGDCDDLHGAVYPSAPQICDALNNNCLASGWPSLAGTNDGDDDSDGTSECQGDCDDTDSTTNPSAPESNDASDNQCPGSPGFGVVDEISGLTGFTVPGNPSQICWPLQPLASQYEVIKSAGARFLSGCSGGMTSTACWTDATSPAVGSVDYYLVRPISPNVGSWGQVSSGAERTGLCGVETICADGLDNDSDGKADCEDVDCLAAPACVPATYTFTDTTADDVAAGSLHDFFNSLTVTSTTYILVSITGSGLTDFKWCSQHADFYRSSYLALAATSGSAFSGSWDRWTFQEGGAWTGPVTGSYENLYGTMCYDEQSWCPESGLAGYYLGLFPTQTDACESGDLLVGCGTGDWLITIKVGAHRLPTCGF